MRIRNLKGFTVIELLIVIVVIGILAGLTIYGYANIQKRARTSSGAVAAASAIRKAETYSVETAGYPTAPSQLTGAAYNLSYQLKGVTFATAATSSPQALTFIACGASVGVKIGYYDEVSASTLYLYNGTANAANCVSTTGLTT